MQKEKVLEANRRFYTALENLDLEAMDSVWLHEEWVKCVHPGWELLEGWEEVRESWARIFASTQRMQVVISNITVEGENRFAWVCCIEQVTSSYERGFDTALVQATNIFVQQDGDWLMVHHHASPLPRQDKETVQ